MWVETCFSCLAISGNGTEKWPLFNHICSDSKEGKTCLFKVIVIGAGKI